MNDVEFLNNFYFFVMTSTLTCSDDYQQPACNNSNEPITIYPDEISFKNISSHNCYEIQFFVRNQSSVVQKIRLIPPQTKYFKLKKQEILTNKLAQGLAQKIAVFFCCEKISDDSIFLDQIVVCGDTFRHKIVLRAEPSKQNLIIPGVCDVGRLLINHENKKYISVENTGEKAGLLELSCDHNSVTIITKSKKINPGSSAIFQFILHNKKTMTIIDRLKFSNGWESELRGVFVEEGVQVFGREGEKLMMLDIGQVFVGERVEEKIFVLNNSDKVVNTLFRTFNRNVEMSEIKIDQQRGNFVVRQLPQEYAKELKTGFSKVQVEKSFIQPFSEFENQLIIHKVPTETELKKFQRYATGLLQDQITEEPVIETLVINTLNVHHSLKVPIKFISVFPRLKISSAVVDFGEIKERTDYTQELTFHNEGQRDIGMTSEAPQNVRVEGLGMVEGHHSKTVKVVLRTAKLGKINNLITFHLFHGLTLQVKVLATCRSSSIRSKKIFNLNSGRDIPKEFKLYETLCSCRYDRQNSTGPALTLRPTDTLADIRIRKNKAKVHADIMSASQPQLRQPFLNLRREINDLSVTANKTIFLQGRDRDCSKLTVKQMLNSVCPLKVEELERVVLKASEVHFGTIFIESKVEKEIKVCNNNLTPILFEWDVGGSDLFKGTSTEAVKIDGQSEKEFTIRFKPNMLGAINLPLHYVINREHIFEIYVTAYVTLVNLDISTKNVEFGFAPYDSSFEKTQQIELSNKGNFSVKCFLRFQEGKHFQSNRDLQLGPASAQTVTITYRPLEQEGGDRTDTDKLVVKVVGGAENIIKCLGTCHDSKLHIKQSQITCSNHPVSLPHHGKLTLKSASKSEILYRIEVPKELSNILTFDKDTSILCGEEKKEVSFMLVSHEAKSISSFVTVRVRGGKSIRVAVECSFTMPQIDVSQGVLDFGNIPVLGSNYQQIITVTSSFKQEIKLQMARQEGKPCEVEVQQLPKVVTPAPADFPENQPGGVQSRKKFTIKDDTKDKRTKDLPKIIRLFPFEEVQLEVKVVPKMVGTFDIQIPLKLYGTVADHEVYPVPVVLHCTSIEPVVYLHPQKVVFQTKVIGEGKNNFIKYFQIRNPHDEDIEWKIDSGNSPKHSIFYLNQYHGTLEARGSIQLQIVFQPQQEGHFFSKLDVVLKNQSLSHISLELEGDAIFPILKFNCNQVLMPVVPVRVESRSCLSLQNHGYDVITISKWKTLNNFAKVDITVNFPEGRLLSLAKKSLKIEVVCCSELPISFTTMLEFYDQFGGKYEVPLSCTFDNSLMTAFRFLEVESSSIVVDKKENLVKMVPCQSSALTDNCQLGARERAECEFIKNWLNWELNMGVKEFPTCLIQSEGELFYRMVTRMANSELIRRFEPSDSQNFSHNIYSYYSESIRVLKMEGAFLNQIRPEFLLPFKDYQVCLSSKCMVVQNEGSFQALSVHSWMVLFYQLCKLYVLNQVGEKTISRFAPQSSALSSTIYSSQELLVFRFLNSFMADEPSYNLCDKVRVFQIIQRSLEKTLNIKLTSSLLSMKISVVVMTPSLFINLISKFLFQTLKDYGLSMYLLETDLEVLGPKELILFLVSYIDMLYHYANSTPVCFEASIGDKVTKVIEIENPVSRKVKYRLKLQGSQEFCLQEEEVSLGAKGKAEIRVSYHCKHNKDEEASLLLIPAKEDINSGSVQPLSFKLKTSIISKITLKKIQISACLYEVTSVALEAQLPIDITELTEFSVSIMDSDETCPSFFCFQQLNRTLKNNHDRLDLRLVPLSMGPKYCRVCYKSGLFGEFNFQIMGKIELPAVCREIRLKQLKVNKEEVVQVCLPRDNEDLLNAMKYLNDHHCKTPEVQQTKRSISSKQYNFSIVESAYIQVLEESVELSKTQLADKDHIQLDLRCLFGKPFTEYSCTLLLKNETARDLRMFKLITSVAMKPKVVEVELRAKAREATSIKIPIKNAPCDAVLDSTVDELSLNHFSAHFKQNVELTATFAPEWMMRKEVTLTTENRETLEQVIYQITLIGEEPPYFDRIQVAGSAVFSKKVTIHLNLSAGQQMRVQSNSKRLLLEDNARFCPGSKAIKATVLPGLQQEVSSIQLFKEGSSQYYWASLAVVNEKVECLQTIVLEESPNGHKNYLFQGLKLGTDHQISYQQSQFFSCSVVCQLGLRLLSFDFRPWKEMEVTTRIFVITSQKEYQIEVRCLAKAYPAISLPEIVSQNNSGKVSTINVVNNSDRRGTYTATIEPRQFFKLDHDSFEIKGKEKKELKLMFSPQHLQTRYKAVVTFHSPTLPTYEYHFSAISEFKAEQTTIECEYYSDKNSFRDLLFTNWFAGEEQFSIETNFKGSPFEVVEPAESSFSLQSLGSKRVVIKVSQSSKKESTSGRLVIRLKEKSWVYHLIPLQIRNLQKKLNWNCVAREVYYENIELPPEITVKSIEGSPELQPYLSFTSEEGTNNIKLKYCPMKPLPRDQFQILLLTHKSKYLINCTVAVELAPFDDTISIKTKEINQVGCVSFKLTNTKKSNAPFKAYFLKGLPDLMVEVEKNVLESYGRIGTTIFVKFACNVFNKRVEDELWVQTSEMLWRFRVIGLLSKKHALKS